MLMQFICSNIPEQDSISEAAKAKASITYMHLGKLLLDDLKDYHGDKKVQDPQPYKINFDQNRKKAMALKSDQIIRTKDPNYCTGLSFYGMLEILAREACYKISIPETIMIGFNQSYPIVLWTDTNEILRSRELPLESLQEEITRINEFMVNPKYPTSILKYESYNAEGMKTNSEVLVFEVSETQELFWKVQNLRYGNNFIVLQQFIRQKTGTIAKLRVQFEKGNAKVYGIYNHKYTRARKSDDEKLIAENKIIRNTGFLSTNYSNNKRSLLESTDHLEKLIEICDFLYEIFYGMDGKDIERFQRTAEYFNKRKYKIRKCLANLSDSYHLKHTHSMQRTVESRRKFLNKYTAKLTSSNPDVYIVGNFSKLSSISLIINEIIRSSKVNMPKTQRITEMVLDFIEDYNEKIYFLKIHKLIFQDKVIGHVPKWKQFRHVSLFSVTEGSSVAKNKKQQVCCGDYCNLLKKNDPNTSEKIELFIKAMPEHSKALFKLLKLQKILNIDTAQNIFTSGSQNEALLINNTQCKAIRRIILEDRNDPNSLRQILASLPNLIVKELGIPSINLSQFKQNTLHIINKKLSWEYELVPVCSMCYKIYSMKEKSSGASQKKTIEKGISEHKLWKINEVRYKSTINKKASKYFVNYDKVLDNLNQTCEESSIKQIREKIMMSDYVSHKNLPKTLSSSISLAPLKSHFEFTTNISSNIFNEICGKMEAFKKINNPHMMNS